MPEPKKAPAQSSIANFFRPKKEPIVLVESPEEEEIKDNLMEQDDVVDLTGGGSSSLEPIQVEHSVVTVVTVPPTPEVRPVKKHSFFSRFDEKVQKQKEAETSNDARLSFVRQSRQVMKEKAPVFPAFLGNLGPCIEYKSQWTYEMRRDTGFDIVQWSRIPILRCADDDVIGTFEDPPELYRASGVDQVYQAILDRILGKKETKPGRRWIFHDEEDNDDWLPTGFRDLNKPKPNVLESHVHLVVGPTGTGKSYLATRLAAELQAPLTALTVVGNGPKGERTGKPFEDLLTSAEHHDLISGSADMQVVLIDEIDLVFEGDRGFVSGLATYLANVPPKHVVIMTSNAPVNVLARFYSFTRDVCVHELEVKDSPSNRDPEVDFASLERASLGDTMKVRSALAYEGDGPLITCIDSWHGPSNSANQFSQASRSIFSSYSRYITAQKYRAPAPSLSTWHTERLPTWLRLETVHVAAEEERALLKRRRQTTIRFAAGSRITSYLRFPQNITRQVLSLYSLE